MFTVYVIESINFNFRYVGFTSNLFRRLHNHNHGYNKSTKHYKPYKLI
ncbi:MAG: GIY-YIG nuclease family protein [Chlorobi bacterium]|nr:GIY-YIG nuclease family protein [Chlorobiota bacterium]